MQDWISLATVFATLSLPLATVLFTVPVGLVLDPGNDDAFVELLTVCSLPSLAASASAGCCVVVASVP